MQRVSIVRKWHKVGVVLLLAFPFVIANPAPDCASTIGT
jgi:hypothetical protein